MAYLPISYKSCNCNPDLVLVRSASLVLAAFHRRAPPLPFLLPFHPPQCPPPARICILAALIGAIEGKPMVLVTRLAGGGSTRLSLCELIPMEVRTAALAPVRILASMGDRAIQMHTGRPAPSRRSSIGFVHWRSP